MFDDCPRCAGNRTDETGLMLCEKCGGTGKIWGPEIWDDVEDGERGAPLMDAPKYPDGSLVMDHHAAETIRTIARLADQVAAQAGVGGSETAGLVVSVLAMHPELIPRFMADPVGTFLDWRSEGPRPGFSPENGCLSFHSQDGRVRTPQELRTMLDARGKGQNDG